MDRTDHRQTQRRVMDGDKMPGARFFPDARLNFAENLLRHRGAEDAIVFRGENEMVRRLSRDELVEDVSRLVWALRDVGVGPGDRVAGFLPNLPEAVIAMLATASLGATWSSCSPDFGVQGKDHVRLNFATSPDIITEAVHRIAGALRPGA